ncbi:hypothetical protein [Peribacillus sp. ACCC06369]|uniref:hypothetical protein n=1 Tax=Peribacillus sp. ACCC06369 TaxID=3055860 RepID=UPI0025A07625|nr:hypothetical protein [Peribacillus sp. ACCC06369]
MYHSNSPTTGCPPQFIPPFLDNRFIQFRKPYRSALQKMFTDSSYSKIEVSSALVSSIIELALLAPNLPSEHTPFIRL